MSIKVFISYRRDDNAYAARGVHDRLERELGRDSLFMDVDAIPLGVDFVDSAEVAKCDVLLAIIGPTWLEAHDEDGNRRLDDEHDFVRIEIAAALERDIPVIPILLEGTRVPKPERLPDDLKLLSRRNGLEVRHASFPTDMEKLIRALRGIGAPPPPQPAATQLKGKPPAEGRIKIDAPIWHGAPDGWFMPGAGRREWFKDDELGPEMVVVPAGTFMMGSSPSEIAALKQEYSFYLSRWIDSEGPLHFVKFDAPFAVGRFAITFDEWDAGAALSGINTYRPGDHRWGRGKRPVIKVSWDDALAAVEFLTRRTGKNYRLLSESEWEYVTRAGTTTTFWWGDTISTEQANYDGDYVFRGGPTGENRRQTVSVDTFAPNPWGLYNVHGNVWEWCEDTWHANYIGAPADGSAWLQGGDADLRVVRGGAWDDNPHRLRAATRYGELDCKCRDYYLGFRVARTLAP